MLILDHVVKRFGARVAVDDLSLEVRRGEVLGLLGPNGAGKSTTVGLAIGLLAPDAGRVQVGELGNPREARVRGRIGVAPQALAVYELLTARENLRFFADIQGLDRCTGDARVRWCLTFAGLDDRAGDRVDGYSGGMKRRLNLAAAVVHQPDLLLLDEPTVGVDPQSRNAIFDSIEALGDEGTTIIYTTHYMEEAERLCDRVAIVDEGRLLAIGTVRELVDAHGGVPVLVVRTECGETRHHTGDPLRTLNALAATEAILEFHVERPTLEQVFLRLTGRRLRD